NLRTGYTKMKLSVLSLAVLAISGTATIGKPLSKESGRDSVFSGMNSHQSGKPFGIVSAAVGANTKNVVRQQKSTEELTGLQAVNLMMAENTLSILPDILISIEEYENPEVIIWGVPIVGPFLLPALKDEIKNEGYSLESFIEDVAAVSENPDHPNADRVGKIFKQTHDRTMDALRKQLIK
ncbi:hypothetical protein H4219_006164, partial [Mycoemilia scoparia]